MAFDKSDKVPPSLSAALEALISEGKWFEFSQNNSGGYYLGPAKYVFIQADDSDAAYAILSEQEGFSTSYCECCGERWYWGNEVPPTEMVESMLRLSDPKSYSNKYHDECPTALIVPLTAPNKAQKAPFTLEAFVSEVLTATGEAFEDNPEVVI